MLSRAKAGYARPETTIIPGKTRVWTELDFGRRDAPRRMAVTDPIFGGFGSILALANGISPVVQHKQVE